MHLEFVLVCLESKVFIGCCLVQTRKGSSDRCLLNEHVSVYKVHPFVFFLELKLKGLNMFTVHAPIKLGAVQNRKSKFFLESSHVP